MKRTLVVALLVLIGLGVTALGAPKISVDQPQYNFGEVIAGIAVVHTFILTNTGDQPLVIKSVRTSCGCTTAALAKTTLNPGEAVNLAVTFDTAGYSGKVGKSIYVTSNDPATPVLTLILTGTVKHGAPYNISAADLNYLFYVLIDIRPAKEYAESHLLGAINIPYAELPKWLNKLPKAVLIVLYDDNGTLSDKAAQMMIKAGFSQAKSLLGGLTEWQRIYRDRFLFTP